MLARPGETSEPDELFLQRTFEVDYTDMQFSLVISLLLWRHFFESNNPLNAPEEKPPVVTPNQAVVTRYQAAFASVSYPCLALSNY